MTTTAYQDARDERTAQAKQLLEQGIGAILDSDAFAGYLRTLSKLHRYSWRNVMLMLQQRPSVTLPNSYTRWQELGRQVRKGETGMRIFVPIMPKRATATDASADDTEPQARRAPVAFTLGSVFDIAQTDGADLALLDAPEELTGASTTGADLYGALLAWLAADGVTVTVAETGDAKGTYHYGTHAITLAPHLTGDQATKTLAHEAAHHVCRHGRESITASDAETIAESVAFVVCHAHGIDSGDYSFTYVATWARDREVLTRNLDTIQKAAHTILDGLAA